MEKAKFPTAIKLAQTIWKPITLAPFNNIDIGPPRLNKITHKPSPTRKTKSGLTSGPTQNSITLPPKITKNKDGSKLMQKDKSSDRLKILRTHARSLRAIASP